MGADCSLPSHKYTQLYLPADCFRSCCPGPPNCDNHRSHGSKRSNYWYVERGGNGKDRYHDPFDYMDRVFARGGAMQMMMPGGWPGMPMQGPMGMGMNVGYGNMAGYANGHGSGPYGGGCGAGGIMGPGPWPGGWKPSSEWTGRDYSLLGEILNEYSAREKGKGRLPWGPWGDTTMPPWCPPPSWAGPQSWTDPYSSSGRKPWNPPSQDKDIDALLAARLRQMSAANDPLMATQDSPAAKSYAEQISQLHDMLFGSNAEQKQKQYLEKLSQNFRQMQTNGMMNDPGSLQAQIQQLQAQFAAALGGQGLPGTGGAGAGGGRESLERDLRQMMAERAAANGMRRRGGNGLRGRRRRGGGFDAEDDDWGDEWEDDERDGGGRRGNRGGRTNGRNESRRGPPRRPLRPNNSGPSGTGAFPDAASSNNGALDHPYASNPYHPQPANPTNFPSSPPFRSTIPVPNPQTQPHHYADESFYPSRPAGPSPPTPDRPLTPVPLADLPDEIRRPLSPMHMPVPRPGGPGGPSGMGWGYAARVEEVKDIERGREWGAGGMGIGRLPTYVSREDKGAGVEGREGVQGFAGARHVSFGDIAPLGRQEPPLGGVKEV
ncbi:hypothetical protein B0A48_02006 [Cryoendolithus antarcticus]|uniref:Uncharacterized protein n=1 Tax=Cryoendolithus antarcticus TaxID=1507870 RepID=A0A1V8TR07_9PEZI|nr:hypothetical protein B0A48_02006 [Cryoendolithus antarcticus]